MFVPMIHRFQSDDDTNEFLEISANDDWNIHTHDPTSKKALYLREKPTKIHYILLNIQLYL
jgi:hypothetical protein